MKEKIKRMQLLEIFIVSLRLGITSFGGPIAHLGYFQQEYVRKRKWLDDRAYADLIALCQFLPGPASSQVGISIGMLRGGLLGGVISWLGFTLPSVIALILFATIIQSFNGSDVPGWIQGLKIVAVAVVAHALYNMGKSLTPDHIRISIAFLSAIIIFVFPFAWIQLVVILIGAIIGLCLFRTQVLEESKPITLVFGKKLGASSLILFFLLLIGIPIIYRFVPNFHLGLIDVFYRVGSIVYGGGHVVLPLLEKEVVSTGWITAESFITGYGAAQAVPGPLFTFASYIGTIAGGISGGIVATIAMFFPSFLLVVGVLPFWNGIRNNMIFRAALTGVNATVVGLLLAALYDPVFTSAIIGPIEFSIALFSYAMLVFWKLPPGIVVLLTALIGQFAL
ncbi:chromate efflux transporter [Caldibacillus lycopersici]|uniref:Chromate efflux transporter n=1 Tax=Perspicuibacillus lycopersici TaxID=1325689 RepID=A0AAE3ISJ8_9BACI|nr:chromate efflux transporter [Perspicuibacillus lycopersici]MCU9612858.1 chromate efflux transporter [Perspicuibacillus lycopersici]